MAEIAWEAIAPIWDQIPYSNASKLDEFMSNLTKGQKALISIDWSQKEIRNGGIKQLFENSTGNLVPYAIKGLELIGAYNYAEILTEASRLLGNECPKSAAARKRTVKIFNESQKQKVKNLDDQFLELIDSSKHDIELYRGSYVKNNPSQFISS